MLKDLVGLDNGFVKIISFEGISKNVKSGKARRLWNAECRCSKVFCITTYQFTSKKPRSCGCYQQVRKGNVLHHDYHITHGLSRGYKHHPIIKMLKNIKSRCHGKTKLEKNKCYWGKGITLCDEWRYDAVKFVDWVLANGWKPGLCIDRIDTNKGYMPGNIQFITRSENASKVHKDNPKYNVGSNNHGAKINESDVKEIRQLSLQGLTNRKIAQIYNIKENVVYQIKYRKTWKHVE